jgi:hypothetical protein
MKVYRFKVSLFDDKEIYREIDILGAQTLEDFHKIIFEAFDRDDPHLYSFFLTRKSVSRPQKAYDFPEYTLPIDDEAFLSGGEKQNVQKMEIYSLRLKEKEKMYYLFDYGDSWWHEITLLSITDSKVIIGFPKIVKKVGESPAQYPDFEGDWEE